MMYDGKRTQYSKDTLYEYLETNITTDKMSLTLTKDKNKFSIVKDGVALRTVTLSINLLKEQTSEPVDQLIDKYMAEDGIVAYKCTMEDFFWQNETSISSYTCRKRGLEGLKFTTSKIGLPEKIVDIEYNPGHSHRYEGVWFGSCYQMWFGRPYYEFISKERLQSFRNCHENVELENDAIRITLYEDIWDFDNPANRERQWDFRRSMGVDEVAHALLEKPRKSRKHVEPMVEFQKKTENGVEYEWVINYADEKNKPIEKSKAVKKIVYVYVEGNNEPVDTFEETM